MNALDDAQGISAEDDAFRHFPSFRPTQRGGSADLRWRPPVGQYIPVKRGEVHFHHSLTWHGSGRNRHPFRYDLQLARSPLRFL